ncbi:hypothetical protein ACLMJK_008903 [Lecanora helva]
MTTPEIGQLASPKDRFCPYAAVTKWPYRHLYGESSTLVSDEYFAHGKFRSHGWTIYYIHTLLEFQEDKPLLLVPLQEVEDLFHKIYKELGIYCTFPNITRHSGFQLDFDDGPRPRYLGRLTEYCSILELQAMIPDSMHEESQVVEDRSFPAFRRKMEAAILAGKNRQKHAKEKKKRDRVDTKRGWCAQLRRTQCYLGVRSRGTVDKEDFIGNPNQNYEEAKAAQEAYEKAAGLKLPDLIPTEKAPHPFDQDVIFVSVDVEAYEKSRNIITEIGVSTLDTRDLENVPPGEGGQEWMKKIRARHFRIAEHGFYRNTEYVTGCADNFEEKFGTSEWISLKEAPEVVASCFRYPFSAPGKYVPYPHDPKMAGTGTSGCGSLCIPTIEKTSQPKRNIVLVGHDIKADIDYLRNMGYDVTNLSNLLEAVDTVDLFRAMKHERNPRNLGAVLLELELVAWHLHNAGNDAGYTLEALIGISIAALSTTHNPAPDPSSLDLAAAEAQARLIEDLEEWEIADEECGDGGNAVKLPSYEEMIDRREFDQSMRRANRAEAKRNANFVKGRGGGGGGKGGGSAKGGDGEITFHDANEKQLKEVRSRTPPHLRAAKHQDKKRKGVDDEEEGEEGGGVPVPPLSQKTKDRLAALDDDYDDYFII